MMRRAAPETIAVAEIGGTSVKIGFALGALPVAFTRTYPTAGLRQGAPIAKLAGLLRAASSEAGMKPDRVVATVPGFIGLDFDTILHTANIPELNGVRLASELALELGMPVRLERDVVLQLLGESVAGAVIGEYEVLAVYLGTGIGAAYLGKGGIFRGGGWALEIGHMPVYRPGTGDRQPKRIETYASGTALVELAAAHGVAVSELFQVSRSLPRLGEALDDVLSHQAATIASAAALFSPRIILIGGGMIEMNEYPREILKQRIGECLPHSDRIQPLDIRRASLGWQAAIHGAVLIGHENDPIEHNG
jgi:allose kinase